MDNIEIITESTAIELINEVLDEMDLDDLAEIVSKIAKAGRVVVVHDGNDGITAEKIVEDDIPCSDVFEDSLAIGYLDENGDVIEIGDRYQLGEPCSEQDVGEFMTAIEAREMLPIFDENQGRVVAWVYANESQLIDGLNGKRN